MYDDNILPSIHGFELLLIRNFITQGTMGKVSSVCITFAGTAERLCSSCAPVACDRWVWCEPE